MVTSFSVNHDAEEARRRGLDGFRFFQFGLGHHYAFGKHVPGRTDIWKQYEAMRGSLPEVGMGEGGIGTPEQVTAHLQQFADAGVDQVVFIQQGGNNQHAHICESLELFSREVMPHFKAGEAERERKKLARLAPALERAMARKNRMKELADSEIPPITPYGFAIAETSGGTALDEATRRRQERMREMTEAVRKAGN
jgi:hypothetical protein